MSRRAAALAAAATLLVTLAGCETTQERSAKIGRQLGTQSAVAGQTHLGRASTAVRITRKVLLSSAGTTAVALQLTNTSAQAQVGFPVLIDVSDATGRSVYRNDTKGIEPSLQQLALLAPHASAWWVDNEVLASTAKSVSAKIGSSAATAPATLPQIATSKASASASFPGPHISATVTNHSKLAQSALAVYGVVIDGSKLVGAGRAVVATLAPGASAQIVIPVVGAINGRTIVLTTAPTTLR